MIPLTRMKKFVAGWTKKDSKTLSSSASHPIIKLENQIMEEPTQNPEPQPTIQARKVIFVRVPKYRLVTLITTGAYIAPSVVSKGLPPGCSFSGIENDPEDSESLLFVYSHESKAQGQFVDVEFERVTELPNS